MTLAVAVCHCSVCRNPDGDDAVQALHSDRHLAFERFRAEMPDWHGFTPPTEHDVLRWTIAEYDVPRDCPRLEDIGKPAHPAHT